MVQIKLSHTIKLTDIGSSIHFISSFFLEIIIFWHKPSETIAVFPFWMKAHILALRFVSLELLMSNIVAIEWWLILNKNQKIKSKYIVASVWVHWTDSVCKRVGENDVSGNFSLEVEDVPPSRLRSSETPRLPDSEAPRRTLCLSFPQGEHIYHKPYIESPVAILRSVNGCKTVNHFHANLSMWLMCECVAYSEHDVKDD